MHRIKLPKPNASDRHHHQSSKYVPAAGASRLCHMPGRKFDQRVRNSKKVQTRRGGCTRRRHGNNGTRSNSQVSCMGRGAERSSQPVFQLPSSHLPIRAPRARRAAKARARGHPSAIEARGGARGAGRPSGGRRTSRPLIPISQTLVVSRGGQAKRSARPRRRRAAARACERRATHPPPSVPPSLHAAPPQQPPCGALTGGVSPLS